MFSGLIYLAISGTGLFLLGRLLPKKIFCADCFPYKSFAFEDEGRLYNKLCISRWQSRVPDMSRIFMRIMPLKRINGRPGDAQLVRMIQETCVAEFIHALLCVTGLYVLKLCAGVRGWILYGLYVLLGNVPFILIQRYNRPRLVRLLERSRERAEKIRIREGKQKALILSCNTGEGHNSCANAVCEAFREHGLDCEVVDSLGFVSPLASRFMAWGHVFIYRHMPKLFRLGYRLSEKRDGLFRDKSLFYRMLSLGREPLTGFILEGGYSMVICPHVFSAIMITQIQKRYGLKIKTSFIATDYTCSPGVEMSKLDQYFVPDESLVGEFIAKSISAEKIIASGIPVRRDIYEHSDKSCARRSLDLPEDCRHLLVMCGSMGCGPLNWLILFLSAELEKNQYITLVCGTNKRLKRKMEILYSRNPRIRVLGYRRDISLLMDSADLYLTKPGGLSATEAAVKNLPMVMINAVAGCEEYNRNFFVKNGLGVSAENSLALTRLCRSILSDDAHLQRMKTAGKQIQRRNSAAIICDKMLQ